MQLDSKRLRKFAAPKHKVRMFKFVYTNQASDYGLGSLSVIDLSIPKREHYYMPIYTYMYSCIRQLTYVIRRIIVCYQSRNDSGGDCYG